MRPNAKFFTPSLLDRFEVDNPKVPGIGAPLYQSREDWETSLMMDVIELLNSRFVASELSDKYPSLSSSIFCYGLPDFSNMSITETMFVPSVKEYINRALSLFESRLIDVEISEPEALDSKNEQGETKARTNFAFRISGRIRSDPDGPRMHFQTSLDLASRWFKVGEDK